VRFLKAGHIFDHPPWPCPCFPRVRRGHEGATAIVLRSHPVAEGAMSSKPRTRWRPGRLTMRRGPVPSPAERRHGGLGLYPLRPGHPRAPNLFSPRVTAADPLASLFGRLGIGFSFAQRSADCHGEVAHPAFPLRPVPDPPNCAVVWIVGLGIPSDLKS
jgi:hypothetical protein